MVSRILAFVVDIFILVDCVFMVRKNWRNKIIVLQACVGHKFLLLNYNSEEQDSHRILNYEFRSHNVQNFAEFAKHAYFEL